MYSLIKGAHTRLREDVQHLVRAMAAHSSSRLCLNLMYSALPNREKARFHALCWHLFDDHGQQLENGSWIVKFAGKRLVLPLTPEGAWQEWDAAVAILGHDLEIKTTYANLLRWRRPKLFFDVGANYGLHSLLFLVHGIITVSFEPNANCHAYLRRVCELNNLVCNIQPVALSDVEGFTELWFPERQTWMGTTDARVRESLGKDFGLISLQAKQTTIDKFVARHGCHPDLIKIDTEGNELHILRGSRETLRFLRPLVIFESWPDGREGLFHMFEEEGYRISPLPLRPRSPSRVLEKCSFLEHPGRNFIAFGAEQVASGGGLL